MDDTSSQSWNVPLTHYKTLDNNPIQRRRIAELTKMGLQRLTRIARDEGVDVDAAAAKLAQHFPAPPHQTPAVVADYENRTKTAIAAYAIDHKRQALAAVDAGKPVPGFVLVEIGFTGTAPNGVKYIGGVPQKASSATTSSPDASPAATHSPQPGTPAHYAAWKPSRFGRGNGEGGALTPAQEGRARETYRAEHGMDAPADGGNAGVQHGGTGAGSAGGG